MEPILKKAKELFEIEQQYISLINREKVPDIFEVVSLVFKALSLKDDLNLDIVKNDPSSLKIDNDHIRNTLKMVRNGKGLKCIDAYESLKEYVKPIIESRNIQKTDERDFVENNWDDLFNIYHTRFDINAYFQNKLKIGPLITSSTVPEQLESYFTEVKEAYSYGLNKACVAICRMLIEISYADVLNKIPEYKNALKLNGAARDKKNFEFGLYENINIALSLNIVSNQTATKSHKIRLDGNKIIHSGKTGTIKEADVIDIIEKTILIIETLYG